MTAPRPTADLSRRWRRAQEAMQERGLAGLLLTTEPSVFYFSSTISSRPPALVLSSQAGSRPVLVCRAVERANVAAVTELEVVGAEASNAAQVVADVMRDMGIVGHPVGFEDVAMTVAQHKTLSDAAPTVRLVPASELVQRVRLVKEPGEIEHMRAAGYVSDLAMTAAIHALRSGKNETQAAAAAESMMRQHGMFVSYETLIGSGFRSGLLRRYPHFEKPDPDAIVKIDLAAKRSFAVGYAYHTDQTRSITTGSATKAKRDVLDIVVEVQQATLEGLRPNRTIGDVAAEGLAVVKGTRWQQWTSMAGHGIGLEAHEWPAFHETSDVVLEVGQCFAIEPHLVVPEVHTVCVEDTIVITDGGYDRITNLPHRYW